jgi:precorrin-2 dehydrogenase/sirohydrochlorin ferrochelatase
MFAKLEGKRCLMVGAGKVGEPKIGGLLDTGASIHVVALQASAAVNAWARAGKITLDLRAFAAKDLDGAFLAVVATASRTLNATIYREAQRRGVLCNVVDVPEYCDFYYPAVVRRGSLQIAISTGGESPSLAARLRAELERQFGPEYGAWVKRLGRARAGILRRVLDPKKKRRILHRQASAAGFRSFRRGKTRPNRARKRFHAED